VGGHALLALGVAPLAGLYRAIDDDTAVATLHHAWTRGIDALDVAPLYGHGRGEARLARYRAAFPADNFRITTKVGRRLRARAADVPAPGDFVDPLPFTPVFDYSADGIRRGFDDSLARLGVGYVDTLLLHDIGERTHGDAHREILRQALDQALPAMDGLKAAGRVGAIGLGVNEWEVADVVLARAPIDVVLLAGRYTLLDQSGLAFLDRAHAAGTAIHAAGVFNSGLLAGGRTFDYQAAPPAMIARRDRLRAICARYDVELAAAALRFPLAHPAVTRLVVGLASTVEIDACLANLALPIPAELWRALKADAMLAADAPTP
jgi:D-threo-aldose 1-dehydrogenase